MSNPIIDLYRAPGFLNGLADRSQAVHIFDAANGKAWADAGSPDDGPGSEWSAWEAEALRVIESEMIAPADMLDWYFWAQSVIGSLDESDYAEEIAAFNSLDERTSL